MASGRAIADQIASEGIVLLKNDDKALPLSAGTKLNLFDWSSVRPLYGGTGSGDSDTSNAVSLIDGLKHAGFEVNEELAQFYDFTTQAEDLDAGKSYLELSNREIAMVDRVCKEFKNADHRGE